MGHGENRAVSKMVTSLKMKFLCKFLTGFQYSKCPKISYTKCSDKIVYANSVDPNQTAPEGAV